MAIWRQLTRGLRALTNRPATDQEVDDEVQDYFERSVAAHVASGLAPQAAERAARLEVGSASDVREEVRGYGWENLIETALADLRYAVRRLLAAPGFTAVTVLTLAVGVGATTAIVSAVNQILFRPLPYPQADRVMTVVELRSDGGRASGTFGMYRGFTERTSGFTALSVFKPWQPTLGRGFEASDDQVNAPRVVIISDGLLRRRYQGDRAIVGRTIRLDSDDYTVIGVMPAGFENVPAASAELWAPLQYDLTSGRAWGHHLLTIGRLGPGVSVDQANREISAAGRAVLTEQHPETYDPNTRFLVLSLRSELTRGVRPALLAILGAVILVLLIAGVNVTNLLLARGVQRRGEFALRAALGAGRNRLIRQLLTESLLLATLGGLAGLAVAMAGVRALVALSPPGLPRLNEVGVDGTVFFIGLGVSTLIGLLVGITPALQAARGDPHQDLQQGSLRTAGGHRRIRGALVIAEVALALVLLVGSGLLLRSLTRLFKVEAGFDSPGLLTMQIPTSGNRFESDSVRVQFFANARDAVLRVPGVTAAGLTSQLPLSGDLDEYGVGFDATANQPAQTYSSYRYAVSPGYLDMMGIPLRAGRLLQETDRAGAPQVALISESLARVRFQGESPIGREIHIGGGPGARSYTIVGVVGDVRQVSLAMSQSEAAYITESQWIFPDNAMSMVVRTRGDPAKLAASIRDAIWSVDQDQPVVRVATMDDLLAGSAAERRFALILFEAFALAALVLAAAGIYGVLSGSVAERTREIGVRSALGATPGSIVALVVGQGMSLTGLGLFIGLAFAAAASQLMATMLFGVSHLDPITYAGAIVLLAGIALVACGAPAWRAVQVDPATTLRAE